MFGFCCVCFLVFGFYHGCLVFGVLGVMCLVFLRPVSAVWFLSWIFGFLLLSLVFTMHVWFTMHNIGFSWVCFYVFGFITVVLFSVRFVSCVWFLLRLVSGAWFLSWMFGFRLPCLVFIMHVWFTIYNIGFRWICSYVFGSYHGCLVFGAVCVMCLVFTASGFMCLVFVMDVWFSLGALCRARFVSWMSGCVWFLSSKSI